MLIHLSPMRSVLTLTAPVAGDILTLNGEVFDFGAPPEGATLPCEAAVCDWPASNVERLSD